jgi:hypothetical protein
MKLLYASNLISTESFVEYYYTHFSLIMRKYLESYHSIPNSRRSQVKQGEVRDVCNITIWILTGEMPCGWNFKNGSCNLLPCEQENTTSKNSFNVYWTLWCSWYCKTLFTYLYFVVSFCLQNSGRPFLIDTLAKAQRLGTKNECKLLMVSSFHHLSLLWKFTMLYSMRMPKVLILEFWIHFLD